MVLGCVAAKQTFYQQLQEAFFQQELIERYPQSVSQVSGKEGEINNGINSIRLEKKYVGKLCLLDITDEQCFESYVLANGLGYLMAGMWGDGENNVKYGDPFAFKPVDYWNEQNVNGNHQIYSVLVLLGKNDPINDFKKYLPLIEIALEFPCARIVVALPLTLDYPTQEKKLNDFGKNSLNLEYSIVFPIGTAEDFPSAVQSAVAESCVLNLLRPCRPLTGFSPTTMALQLMRVKTQLKRVPMPPMRYNKFLKIRIDRLKSQIAKKHESKRKYEDKQLKLDIAIEKLQEQLMEETEKLSDAEQKEWEDNNGQKRENLVTESQSSSESEVPKQGRVLSAAQIFKQSSAHHEQTVGQQKMDKRKTDAVIQKQKAEREAVLRLKAQTTRERAVEQQKQQEQEQQEQQEQQKQQNVQTNQKNVQTARKSAQIAPKSNTQRQQTEQRHPLATTKQTQAQTQRKSTQPKPKIAAVAPKSIQFIGDQKYGFILISDGVRETFQHYIEKLETEFPAYLSKLLSTSKVSVKVEVVKQLNEVSEGFLIVIDCCSSLNAEELLSKQDRILDGMNTFKLIRRVRGSLFWLFLHESDELEILSTEIPIPSKFHSGTKLLDEQPDKQLFHLSTRQLESLDGTNFITYLKTAFL